MISSTATIILKGQLTKLQMKGRFLYDCYEQKLKKRLNKV